MISKYINKIAKFCIMKIFFSLLTSKFYIISHLKVSLPMNEIVMHRTVFFVNCLKNMLMTKFVRSGNLAVNGISAIKLK